MKKYFYCLLLLTAFLLLPSAYCLLPTAYSGVVLASDDLFTGPSNWGGTGLMEIPTARVMKEHGLRIGISQVHPYRSYYGAISPLKGLEIGGRIVEVLGSAAETAAQNPLFKGYGNDKSKVLDLKYQMVSEGKYVPAVSVGVMDMIGTRQFASQYLVLSKQIYPFDFTLGYGNGWLGKKALSGGGEGMHVEMLSDPKGWLRDSQFFGGIQFMPTTKYALMAEYSPIKYENQAMESARRSFPRPVPSPYNFGFRWIPSQWFELGLSYQRGNQLGFNISLPFEIGRTMLPIYDYPYKEPPDARGLAWKERMKLGLLYSDFSDFGIHRNARSLIIDVENNKYFYNVSAVMALLRTIAPMLPEDVEDITIVFKDEGIPMFAFHTTRSDIIDLFNARLTRGEFFSLSKFETRNLHIPEGPKDVKSEGMFYGWSPNVSLFLNDPSGFFKGSIGVLGWTGYVPWQGASFVAGAALFPFSDISSSTNPLSIPVRSDITLYMKKKLILDKLFFQQIYRFSPDVFVRATAGILEMEYTGLDAEIAKPFFDGRLLLGAGGSAVKKRDPDNYFFLKKKDDVKSVYTTAFLNARLNFPKSGVSFDVKYGRFLAGDVGTRITVSKNIKGVNLYAWYSVTDTSVFKPNDIDNRGYHDKGIGFRVPMRLFFGKETKMSYEQKMSPWTRDVAQDINHFTPLFDFIGENTKIMLDKGKREMY